MFTALTLSLVLGAPVPKDTPAPPAGTAPRLMELKANADGKVMVAVTRTELIKQQITVLRAVAGQPAVPQVEEREVPVMKQMTVELGDVKDLAVTTADGKKLEKDEAMKKLAGGAIVVVSGDGKPVSPAFLKVFKDETLVLASPELVAPQGPTSAVRPGLVRPLPAVVPPAAGGIQILPANPGGAVQGRVIQIQVAPAVLPAVPAVPVKPEKNEK